MAETGKARLGILDMQQEKLTFRKGLSGSRNISHRYRLSLLDQNDTDVYDDFSGVRVRPQHQQV